MNKEFFVQNVKELCLKQGIKPTNACKESGVGGSFLSDISRGQTPSVAKVQLLAEYLGVTTSVLLGEEKPTPVSERELAPEFVQIFEQLSVEEQISIVKQMKGLLAKD